jgi:hypothetical protein
VIFAIWHGEFALFLGTTQPELVSGCGYRCIAPSKEQSGRTPFMHFGARRGKWSPRHELATRDSPGNWQIPDGAKKMRHRTNLGKSDAVAGGQVSAFLGDFDPTLSVHCVSEEADLLTGARTVAAATAYSAKLTFLKPAELAVTVTVPTVWGKVR